MRKLLTLLLVLSMAVAMVGCDKKKTDKNTISKVEEGNGIEDSTEAEKDETSTTVEIEDTSKQDEDASVTTEEDTQDSEQEATEVPTEKPTEKPTEAPTEKPTEAPAEKPTEAEIVKKVGSVDNTEYAKVVSAFESIVKKMRTDGIVKSSEVCVTMDSTSIKVDITFNNKTTDLVLTKDSSTNIYTLALDYDFEWLEGFASTVNGKDSATYNKEMLIALLSIVSGESEALFDTIDLTYHSSYCLSTTDWTAVGDCYMIDGASSVANAFSYKITKEAPAPTYNRDSTFVIKGTTSAGKSIECVIEYDSSIANFETGNNGQGIMSAVNDEAFGPFGTFNIKNDSSSYENYKSNLLASFVAKGDQDASITEYSEYTVNGYTYYWLEGFYKTQTEIGDPDIVYVQVGQNEYIEIYNIWFETELEVLVNEAFYVKNVSVK